MNIKEAKQEIINTVKAYTAKDETGAYRIPVEKQRPMLLIGPPGVGKTAIMEQVAEELHINLVAYTITHHTRQSAIGLPFIVKKMYGGKEYSVTEYTMSEIVASVYDQIERSGVKEGILFLDEINCVSETLAPTMLQFLQYKTFGTHRIPDGFVIVTAGNPARYNKSVRDFDIVTLDRVRRLDITEDFNVWKEYAYRAGIHGAIMAYLEIRKENFYSIRTDVEERYFVTARGWEDLSQAISVYEKLGIPVTGTLTSQYLQDPEISADFAAYYELYGKYQNVYKVPQILEGTWPKETESLKNAPFDEKLSMISLLIDRLNQEFRSYAENLEVQTALFSDMKTLREEAKSGRQAGAAVKELRRGREAALQQGLDSRMLSRDEARKERLVIFALQDLEKELTVSGTGDPKEDFSLASSWFSEREKKRAGEIQAADRHLTNSFQFMAQTFGEGQEMVIFLSELSAGYYSLKFVQDCGNDAFYKYNRLLLLKDRQSDLRKEVMRIQELNG